nr:Os10g0565150 [Ipomoea batatas]
MSVTSYHGNGLLPLVASISSSMIVRQTEICQAGHLELGRAVKVDAVWPDVQKHLVNFGYGTYLLNEFLRSTLGLGRLFGVSHLKASEIQSGMVPCQHPGNRPITVSSRHIVESGGELRRMAHMVVPPVYFGSYVDAEPNENFVGFFEDLIAMDDELVGVPGQEKLAHIRLVSPVWAEEFRLVRRVVSYLESGAALEETLIVDAEREVLLVSVTGPVGVEDIGVFVADLENPLRDGDEDGVADIAAALVKRHDRLDFEPTFLNQLE